ncbi:MAG: hypothetical protein WDN00_06425 [Limisphaerales bacterium]
MKNSIVANLPLLAIGFLLFPAASARSENSSTPPVPVRADGTNLWFDLRQFNVEGRGWNDTKEFYDRLPAKAEGIVRPAGLGFEP